MSDRLDAIQVPAAGTVRDALLALDHGGLGVALVTEPNGRLIGLLTDGDVRRALLAGATLTSPVTSFLQPRYVSVGVEVGRAEVLDLMQARRINVVPIVGPSGELRGCHQLHDVIGVAQRECWAVIMVGGRGARLGHLTRTTPKPMLRVAGRPILERLVLQLVGHGIRRIFLAINYLGHVIEDHFGNGALFGCSIEYLREERELGTAGALALLPAAPNHPVLVLNGDLVTQADFGAMLDAHESAPDTALTLAIRRYLHNVPFGCVEVSGDEVLAIEEKPMLAKMINAGMYVLSPSALALVPRNEPSDMPALVAACLGNNRRVRPFEIVDDWVDVGQKEQLQTARGVSK